MEILAHLMLADHAVSVGGRLYINGGCWNVRSPQPGPWALAMEIKVPWHDNNRRFTYKLELLDADGQPHEVETSDGPQPVKFEGDFHLTAGPGAKPGSQIVGPVGLNLPPMPLPAGDQFEWRLEIDGVTRDEWRAAFAVAALPNRQQRRAS